MSQQVFRAATSLAALSLLIACGPKSQTLVADPSFTPDALARESVGLLGTVGTYVTTSDQQGIEPVLDGIACHELSEALSDVSVWPVDTMRAVLGDSLLEALRSSLEEQDQISADHRSRLQEHAESLPGYLLLARVEKHQAYYQWATDSFGTPVDDAGTGFRKMDLRILIYSTATGNVAWDSRMTHTDFVYNTRSEGVALGPIQLGGDDEGWTPPPPDLKEHVAAIYRKLGDQLAKQEQ